MTARDDELRTLTDQVLHPEGSGAVLVGPRGCGCTRLARETVDRAREAGRPTAWATGTDAARALPLGALAHLVPPGPGEPFEMLQRAVGALGDRSGRCVLAVDDAHLLDSLSQTLLQQLAAGDRVSLVLTTRPGGVGEEGLAPLWKDGALTRIDVGPLTRAGTDRLLGAALRGGVDARTAERLWRLTRGVPRHLREVVESGLADGSLRADGGPWHWAGPVEPGPRVVDVVRVEIGPLDAAGERVLGLLALAGELPVERLVALAGSAAVAELERRGLLTAGPRAARLAHPLHALVLNRTMPAATASALRAELPTGAARDVLRASRNGDVPAAPAAVVGAAARLALARGDLPAAERLGRAAGEPASAAEAALGRGRIAEARLLARDVPDLAPIVSALAGDAPASSPATPPEQVAGALSALLAGNPVTAAALGVPLLGGAPSPVRTLAAAVVAAALAGAGDDAGARAALDAAGSASGPLAATARVAVAEAGLIVDLAAGRLDAVEAGARRWQRRALAADGGPGDVTPTLYLGRAALAAGRLPRAVRLLSAADAGLARADPAGERPICAAQLARARVLLGERVALGDGGPGFRSVAAWAPARAWSAAASGSDPLPALRGTAEAARDRGAVMVEADLRHVAARLGDAPSAAPRLAALAAGGHPHLGRLAEHAAALDARSGERLDAVAEAFAGAGALLDAADAAAAAAAAHSRAAGRRAASRSAARAAELAGRCGHPRTPALVALAPPRLTRRELEVSTLVAAGSSSADVARRLVLSVRTVEAHVAHAYAKLGVHDRAGLRAALPDSEG